MPSQSRYVNKKCDVPPSPGVPVRENPPDPAPWPRKVFEVYSGHDLEFDGAIVVEDIDGVLRILFWAQSKGASQPYASDAERDADRLHMVRIAEAVAADQANYRRFRPDFIDFRHFGLPGSKERMPDEPYGWWVYAPGRFTKDHARHIFPYCPFRVAEMIDDAKRIHRATRGRKGARHAG